MNDVAVFPLSERLQQIEARLAKRDAIVTSVYSILCLAAVALFVLFPFALSRAGSVVLIVGFGYMVWRCKCAPGREAARGTLVEKLAIVNRQIEFAQTVIYNIPFFVGANLFWMGLPGTGTTLEKAVQDFVFLGGTSLLFAASCLFNQHLIRKELMPLRDELQRLVEDAPATQ